MPQRSARRGEKKVCQPTSSAKKCGIDSKTIRQLRANENMESKLLDKLCMILDCALEDIAEF